VTPNIRVPQDSLGCFVSHPAGLIYVNIAHNFRDHKEEFKAHFQKLGLSLFQ
jgi:hypothetical protein